MTQKQRKTEAQTAKALLEQAKSPIVPETLFKAIARAGLVEKTTYLSSTGSGEIKDFWAFTERGLKYGINKPTPSPTKTELRFFGPTFPELLLIAARAITEHAEELILQTEARNG